MPRKLLSAVVITALASTVPVPAQAQAPASVIAISPTDTPAQIRAKAARVVPSERQLAWQRQELTGFVHFGVNTFTGREHGTGTEDPNVFQPDELDTDQWMRTFKDAGFKLVVLTTKHHDGFFLQPSRYTDFDVESTSWENGRGDVVARFAESARRFGIKIGFYVSPSDLHEAQDGRRYANGSKSVPRTIPSDPASVVDDRTFDFVADDYNTYFMNGLYELLTKYGDVAEVWWDGANPTGKSNPYNYSDWISMVRALQPGASIFEHVDLRWVGNEDGVGRRSEWSPLPFKGDPATAANRFMEPENVRATDLGGNPVLAQRDADGTSKWDLIRWSPAECDTSIMTDGWFYPTSGVKSAEHLKNTYYESTGRNCQLLLNAGPDTRGLIPDDQVDAFAQLGRTVRDTFDHDLARGTEWLPQYAPAVDGDLDTSYRFGGTTGSIELDLGESGQTFDVISVQEDLRVGMRTTSFAIDVWDGQNYRQIATDTTIGHKKLIRLSEPVSARWVQLRITGARLAPAIAQLGLYQQP